MDNLKRLFHVAVVSCASMGWMSVHAQAASEDTRAVVTTTDDAVLREGTKSVGIVKDIVVVILKTQDDWVYVRTSDGKKGWLPKSQVVRLEQTEPVFGDRIRQNPQDAYAYYLRAVARYRLGHLDQALEDINRYISLVPGSAPSYNWRGNIWDAKGQYDRAVADYNQAIRIGPAHAFYYENAGRSRMAKKDYAQAISNFDEALRRDPGLPSAYQGRAIARAFKGGDPIKVFEDFGKARRLAPEIYGDEGDIDWWLSDDAEAYEKAETELAELPENRIAQFHPEDAHDFATRGWAWFQKRDYAKAAEDYGQAMRLEPKEADWPRYRGWALYEQRRYPAALADYNNAIRLAPKWADAYNERGVIRLRQGDDDGALDDFNQAIQRNAFDTLAKLNRGWLYFQQHKCALSAADFVDAFFGAGNQLRFKQGWSALAQPANAATDFEPLDAYMLSFRGQVRSKQDDPAGALADFQAAEKLDPKFPLPPYYRAQMHLAKGEKEKAIAEFTEAIGRCGEFAWAFYSRGLAHEGLNQYAEAAADFDATIRLGMKTAGAYNARAWNREQNGDFDLAKADYDEALRLDPKAAYIFNNRGWFWVKKKDYPRAIADFDESHKLAPKWSWPLNNRGVAHKNLRQYREAIADYRAAIAADTKIAAAHSNLAWVLATCPDDSLRDGKQAVSLARRACELSDWKTAAFLDSLAAAYAETGDFEQAMQWQAKALELVTGADKDAYRARLDRYQAKRPWRDA